MTMHHQTLVNLLLSCHENPSSGKAETAEGDIYQNVINDLRILTKIVENPKRSFGAREQAAFFFTLWYWQEQPDNHSLAFDYYEMKNNHALCVRRGVLGALDEVGAVEEIKFFLDDEIENIRKQAAQTIRIWTVPVIGKKEK